jgi:hypothetical protein
VPVPGCDAVTLDCGPDCALSGVYECVGYFRAQKLDLTHSMRHRPWWVKGGESFDTPHGNHPEQFQIWFNQDHWRIGYSASYWYVNSDPDDWGGTKWLPQAVGSQKFPPDFVSLKANGGAPPLTITPSTNARENDYGEYFTFFAWYVSAHPIQSSAVPALLLLCIFTARMLYIQGKKRAISGVPKGTVIFSAEFAQQVQDELSSTQQIQDSPVSESSRSTAVSAVTMGKMVDYTDTHETTDELVVVLKQHEVVVCNEPKGCVYVFDGNDGTDDEDTFIVVQVRHCPKGPPLLPYHQADGTLGWMVAADPYMPFATYLAITMERLTKEDWSGKILPHLRNVYLVRYQAVIQQRDWQKLWDTLMKPFGEQRTTYRKRHRCSVSPDIYFGVEAKPCEASEIPSDAVLHENDTSELPIREDLSTSSGTNHDDISYTGSRSTTTATSSNERRRMEASDGIALPKATEWLEYWQATEIPQTRTFVDFADHVNVQNKQLLRRVVSSPSINHDEYADDDFEERKQAFCEAFRPKPKEGVKVHRL